MSVAGNREFLSDTFEAVLFLSPWSLDRCIFLSAVRVYDTVCFSCLADIPFAWPTEIHIWDLDAVSMRSIYWVLMEAIRDVSFACLCLGSFGPSSSLLSVSATLFSINLVMLLATLE